MPEPPPSGVPENAAVHRPQVLTPEAVETVLADFRSWLLQLPAAESQPPVPEGEPIDLHTLLGQFTALRHDVNLQTRAVRAQQEQHAETLRRLDDALEALHDAQDKERTGQEQAADEVLRPLLKTLVELYDALSLARRELQRVQETVLPVFDRLAADGEPILEVPVLAVPPPAPHAARTPSSWGRWFGRRRAEQDAAGREILERTVAVQQEVLDAQQRQLHLLRERDRQATGAARRAHEFLDSVITGYTMSLQRVERALQQHGLETIPTVGRPFDPEQMEVLEAASSSGRPANEVLDEVRRGYLWRGRIFRYAQVRVAR
jgi:molecular chaperone GrpE